MFNLKTASIEIRECVKASHGITTGKFEPVNAGVSVDALSDEQVVAKVYNRNNPEGVEVTAGDIRYAGLYLRF